ncbi:pilus assembly protein [[Pantoea] beijingensis]|uniref:Pilus assembly protein n=1 Tax=[Pantoea] beijingensis TaxID=1324864 RepID=A0A443IAD7_9GAMM|nr:MULTISPECIES: fimbrial protein [Erwiniaceae]RWR01059.1 pilus assembly protein [[Pantoea] beijingensis]
MFINKKITLLSAVLATLICGAANAADPEPTPVSVNGGKVTFNGEVTAGACAVSGSDTDKIVTLDTVKTSVFKAADQLANAKKPFTISLVDCNTEIAKTVQITFSGQTVEGKPGVLSNNAGAGSAENVGLQLFNPNGTALNVGTISNPVAVTGSTTIPLSVDYKSTAATVTAGKVQSAANFMLTYN